jgi:hypothetical protein
VIQPKPTTTPSHTLPQEALPLHGAHNPSTGRQGTTPGSFALKADIGGPRSFASPDTPGMPEPSKRTAWDFLPEGWSIVAASSHADGCAGHNRTDLGRFIRCVAPKGFEPHAARARAARHHHAARCAASPSASRTSRRAGAR